MISPLEVPGAIEEYLETIPPIGVEVEVGFFGGTFTALSLKEQESFLKPVQKYITGGRIKGIRLSTRPDRIDKKILEVLKKYNVKCIELGVQSMSDNVLRAAKRGHTAEDTARASRMITGEGFVLGHQMMLGLPQSGPEDEFITAGYAKELGASQVRIYPLLVVKDTELAELWSDGKYTPLTEEEAVERSARLILYFESNDIKVIRCGLHPSPCLLDASEFLSGPFHQAFRQKAENRIFSFMLNEIAKRSTGDVLRISFNPKDEASFFGFGQRNSSVLKKLFIGNNDLFDRSENIPKGCLLVEKSSESVLLTRKSLFNKLLAKKYAHYPR